jgi:hypothetical protein
MSAMTQFTTSSPRSLTPISVGMGYDPYNSGTSFSVPTPYSLKNSPGNCSLEGIESKDPEISSEFRVVSPLTLPPNDWMQAASFYHALSRTKAPSPLSFPASPLSSFFTYPATPTPSPTPVFSIPSSPLPWQTNNISPSVSLWQQLQEWAVLLDRLSVAQKEMIWAYFRASPYFQFFPTNLVLDQFKPSPESESFTSLIERWRLSPTFSNLANPAILIFCAAVRQFLAARPTTPLVNQEATEQRGGDGDGNRDRERNKDIITSTSPTNDDDGSKTPRSKAMDVSSLVS